MKKLAYVMLMALAVYAAEGCHSNSGTSQSADSTLKKDSSTTTTATAPTPAVDSSDVKFAMNAAAGGAAEIMFSKLAQQKSSDAQIKSFAAMMVTDHTNAGDTLMGIAKNKGINLPSSPDDKHQKKYDDLSKLSGADFDKAYVKCMVDDHQDALNLMQNEAANGKDADLKAFAGKVVTTVQAHLDAINKIKAGM